MVQRCPVGAVAALTSTWPPSQEVLAELVLLFVSQNSRLHRMSRRKYISDTRFQTPALPTPGGHRPRAPGPCSSPSQAAGWGEGAGHLVPNPSRDRQVSTSSHGPYLWRWRKVAWGSAGRSPQLVPGTEQALSKCWLLRCWNWMETLRVLQVAHGFGWGGDGCRSSCSGLAG